MEVNLKMDDKNLETILRVIANTLREIEKKASGQVLTSFQETLPQFLEREIQPGDNNQPSAIPILGALDLLIRLINERETDWSALP